MRAADILVEEHNVILKVLECTGKIVTAAEANGRLDAEAANQAIEFFREFADRCHHAKEEDRLFLEMEVRGFPRQGGPTGVMLMEHEQGRAFVRGMSEAVAQAASGDAAAIASFGENARNFIALLTNHIAKENEVLFPMADQALDECVKTQLLQDFRDIEAQAGGKRHAQYLAIAQALCERTGVAAIDKAQVQALKSEFVGEK